MRKRTNLMTPKKIDLGINDHPALDVNPEFSKKFRIAAPGESGESVFKTNPLCNYKKNLRLKLRKKNITEEVIEKILQHPKEDLLQVKKYMSEFLKKPNTPSEIIQKLISGVKVSSMNIVQNKKETSYRKSSAKLNFLAQNCEPKTYQEIIDILAELGEKKYLEKLYEFFTNVQEGRNAFYFSDSEDS